MSTVLDSEGWVSFGYHVVDGPCPPVVFGDEVDEMGLPKLEHFDHQRFTEWVIDRERQAAKQALRDAARDYPTSVWRGTHYAAAWLNARSDAL